MLNDLSQAVLEMLFEACVRMPGYWLLRVFRRRVDFSSPAVAIAGIVLWIVLGLLIWLLVWLLVWLFA